jgi:hypothetical protein
MVPVWYLRIRGGHPDYNTDGIGFPDSCQQNGDVPKSPFNYRQPLPSDGKQRFASFALCTQSAAAFFEPR